MGIEGRMVGPYNVGKEIGKGATGTVFIGFDPVKKVKTQASSQCPMEKNVFKISLVLFISVTRRTSSGLQTCS
jgi:hypothetical protein